MNKFQIKIFPNSKIASEFVANKIIALIKTQKKVNLGLATGATPLDIYKFLRCDYQLNKTNYQQVQSFNLDEYYPIDKENKNSYQFYMNNNLFNHINIPKNNVHFPQKDHDFDKLIKENGGIDLQILGIGHNGHIGFNEPNTELDSLTRIVNLSQSTIDANLQYFNSLNEIPKQAISMGLQTILNAKKIILIIFGKNKSFTLKKLLDLNKFDSNLPASCLYLHNDVTLIIDQEAGYDL